MVGINQKIANKSNYGGSRATSKIKYIVIHYTGNDGDSAESNGNYFANHIVKASAHYFVDSDSITQSVPDNYIAWSVGGKFSTTGGAGTYYGKCTNTNSISIELCDDVKNGVVYPTDATIKNAIDLVKVLMAKYNIPISNVIRHYDVNGKKCPAYWVDSTKWKNEFLALITGTTTATTCPYSRPSELLKNGSKGDGVKWLQWHLIRLGFLAEKTSKGTSNIDGIFGSGTEKSVILLQKRLFPSDATQWDGKVGNKTKDAIENA